MEKLLSFCKKYFILIISICLFILVSFWGMITPLFSDDALAVRMSPSEILHSGINDWFVWNGRFVGQTFYRILVNLPPSIYGLVNALVFILLPLLMMVLTFKSSGNLKHKNAKYILILAMIFAFFPNFSLNFLYRAISGNYLWTGIINFLFVILWISYKHNTSKLKNISYSILLIALSVIAGWCNENLGIGIIFLLIGLTLISTKKYKGLNFTKVISVIAYIFGYVMLLIAPGNMVRGRSRDQSFLNKSFIQKIATNLPIINQYIIQHILPLLIIFIIVLFINIYLVKNRYAILSSCILFVSAFITFYALLLSPESVDQSRCYFFGTMLLIIAVVQLIPFSSNDDLIKIVVNSFIVCLCGYVLLTLSTGFVLSYKTDIELLQQQNMIKNKLKNKKNNGNITVPKINNAPYSDYGLWDILSENPSDWQNTCYAHMFKAKSIKVAGNY
ncbi:DUF6056 family protein [Fructilactobacillus fructivorans]|uniref:Uncharacterized protein n=1 Tax=Fructilactobacillus fructivorans TaxID=1614 RepID=A0A0C1PNG8_9LACO|nr:DUF6056 family protein [Fructilactobacillus fructivorans]KID42282.1 hypothetical protein LfDm3_0211 [Fructilactobacillus fructivorans]MCT0151098.1 hypothetical protein [Fructilactobacillus fructivorans]MCT2867344.1 hypothetical protein [Fructilactobacillus fructivorans]MCT2869137.1 hypothetical protein [Fructilactobacillus fructivorans]MCT2873143.1 hypothetical protein [Fructilactobacillus fructivorans]